MGLSFYVWTTQQDNRVRSSHAGREGMIFSWDSPAEGGHPTQDYGCRCFAKPLGIDGYWERIRPAVDAFVADIDRWEGIVDHMYLDTEGNVTVGAAKMLPNAASAAALPFRYRSSGKLALAAEIRAEFNVIVGQPSGEEYGAGFFRQFTSLYLDEADIEPLVREHMRGDVESLVKMYPEFGNFPMSAQIALWDMIYNLGPNGLSKFRRLRQAISQGNWISAAQVSERGGISPERNRFVFDLFMDAANAEN